jgi:hypothetical protein
MALLRAATRERDALASTVAPPGGAVVGTDGLRRRTIADPPVRIERLAETP